ncbi:hypothetical protein EUX98_g4155 [Antrodiella citrinella]|uniref:CN hydrolase domain-containing protein n=1 Tax=Antrodiella citrinella TaxID=2447956 RepID=A0A4S4MUS1_9APHY|nr:hypothetical protein EUX98_g4155 [Antrodiella citrinella]
MCFTGYTFTDSAHITPYLEDPLTGPTSVFCRDLARQKGCYVAAGYAERLGTQETAVVKITREVDEDRWRVKEIRTVEEEVHQVGANSAVVYDPQGVRVGDFRKTNLFETDMTWAKPGTGFKTLHLPPPLNTVTLGICMDLNAQPPAKWTIEGPYEIADHCKSTGTDTLILLNAWLLSGEQERDGRDWGTLNYWATRLRPLWSKSNRRKKSEAAKEGRETKVVICNRCGEENG